MTAAEQHCIIYFRVGNTAFWRNTVMCKPWKINSWSTWKYWHICIDKCYGPECSFNSHWCKKDLVQNKYLNSVAPLESRDKSPNTALAVSAHTAAFRQVQHSLLAWEAECQAAQQGEQRHCFGNSQHFLNSLSNN